MPDAAGTAAPDWTDRLKSLVDQTVERSTASTASFERLLVAAVAPGVDPERWASELTRQTGERGPEAYRELSEVTARFTSESFRLMARYLDEYLRELVPSDRAGQVGMPPAMPLPPVSTDALAWSSWYQRYATWASEQQAWSSRLLTVVRDEVAAGRLHSDVLQQSARRYVEHRLPDYLVASAELNADLVADVLGVADDALERLADALIGREDGGALVVDVRGEAGAAVAVGLVVENSRSEAAAIRCEAAPVTGFALDATPATFTLAPHESRPVSITVQLPSRPTDGAVDGGSVTIRGQDEHDLVVRIRATADAPPAAVTMAAPVEEV
jgi:hypothetical protein